MGVLAGSLADIKTMGREKDLRAPRCATRARSRSHSGRRRSRLSAAAGGASWPPRADIRPPLPPPPGPRYGSGGGRGTARGDGVAGPGGRETCLAFPTCVNFVAPGGTMTARFATGHANPRGVERIGTLEGYGQPDDPGGRVLRDRRRPPCLRPGAARGRGRADLAGVSPLARRGVRPSLRSSASPPCPARPSHRTLRCAMVGSGRPRPAGEAAWEHAV